MLSEYFPRLVPGDLYSQANAEHVCNFRHVPLFDHVRCIEGLQFQGAVVGFKVLSPTAACLFSDRCFYFLSMRVPRVPIRHRVAPRIAGNHTPGRLVVWVFQEAQ